MLVETGLRKKIIQQDKTKIIEQKDLNKYKTFAYIFVEKNLGRKNLQCTIQQTRSKLNAIECAELIVSV